MSDEIEATEPEAEREKTPAELRREERRRTHIPKRYFPFLEELRRNGGLIGRAGRKCDLDEGVLYQDRKHWPAFAAAWDEAKRIGSEKLEEEAYRRGVEGVPKPIFYQGEEVSAVTEYSDALLSQLMKGNMPDRYRERQSVEVTGQDGSPILDRSAMIEEILTRLRKGLGK